MPIEFGPNIQGNIVDSTGQGPGAVSPPSNQGSLYVTGGPHSSGPRQYKRKITPSHVDISGFPSQADQSNFELENLVQQKKYLQQQPSENVPGVNLYQEKMQDFITSSPLNREIYKDRFPIGGAFNLFMTEAPANIAKMSPVGNMVSGILNAFSNKDKKQKTISDTMFAYEQPLDVYKSRTTEAPYQDTFENVQITDTMGSSDIISGLPKVGSPRDTRLEFLLGQENKTAKDLDEIMRLTKERNEKYKSPGLGAEAQSVDPLAVNIKPKQKPGIEQLMEAMNRANSNTGFTPTQARFMFSAFPNQKEGLLAVKGEKDNPDNPLRRASVPSLFTPYAERPTQFFEYTPMQNKIREGSKLENLPNIDIFTMPQGLM